MCTICCEPLNKTTRKPVVCGCEHAACAACTRRYLLESPNEPDCMSCHRRWTVPMLCEKLPKTFVTGPLREHAMEMVVDREKSRLPATQPYAMLGRALLRVRTAIRTNQRLRMLFLNRETDLMLALLYADEEEALFAIMTRLCNLSEQEVQEQLVVITDGPPDAAAERGQPRRQKYQYIRACPADGCRGFLSEKWCCELCETRVCKKCHEIKTEGAEDAEATSAAAAPHTCDPAAVATVALLAKDSRPCPKCAAMIYRIDGCAHMFCTACHTPFHWGTGAIMGESETTNPLYYEWRAARAAAAAPEAAPLPDGLAEPNCDTPEATYNWLQEVFVVYMRTVRGITGVERDNPIARLPILMSHNRHTIANLRENALRWKGRTVRADDPHLMVRISYMLGLFSEAAFKKEIYARERKILATRDYTEVYEMYNAAMGDLALRAFRAREATAIAALLGELGELRKYANNEIAKLSRAHDLKPVVQIGDDYTLRLIRGRRAAV